MSNFLKRLWNRYHDIISYLFFGGCTTLLNICLYYCFSRLFHLSLNASNIAAWIGAVLFAYLTNRKWVFSGAANGTKAVIAELLRFFACRGLTGIMDVAFMYISVSLWGLNDVFMKVISNFLVILVNYVASKLLIFTAGNRTQTGRR